jgi:hypothetical protein
MVGTCIRARHFVARRVPQSGLREDTPASSAPSWRRAHGAQLDALRFAIVHEYDLLLRLIQLAEIGHMQCQPLPASESPPWTQHSAEGSSTKRFRLLIRSLSGECEASGSPGPTKRGLSLRSVSGPLDVGEL